MHVSDAGYVATEPVIKITQGGVKIATFRVAVRRPWTEANGERKSDFFNVVCFRNQADYVENYVENGALIKFKGDMIVRSFPGQDGTPQRSYEVQADQIQQLSRAKDKSGNADTVKVVQDVLTVLAKVPALVPFIGIIADALTPLLQPKQAPAPEAAPETEAPAEPTVPPAREPVGAAAAAAVNGAGFQAPAVDPLNN